MPRQLQAASLVVSVGVQCHVGSERGENQDRVTRARTPFGDLFVVADGIGGYRGGSEAAQATTDGFSNYLKSHADVPLRDALQQAVQAIREDLVSRAAADPELHGMGSTVVLCVVKGDRVTYAHAGDSRLYLLRAGELRPLTSDHSMMGHLVAQGVLTTEQARHHPDASVLTRAIGGASDIALDIDELVLMPDDALLLCSDGLWAYARHQEMEVIAASSLSAGAVADALLNLALEGGGGDNIAIQFLRFKANPVGTFLREKSTPRFKVFVVILLVVLMTTTVIGLFIWNDRHPLSTLADRLSQASSSSMPSGKPPAVPKRHAVNDALPEALQKNTKDTEKLKDKASDGLNKLPN